MKKVFTFLATICCILQLHLAAAQSAEIQQLALNIEKLAQFKQILEDMKKGYEIVSKGYGTIKDISEGNFNLHQAFLDGLLVVNPELRKYRRVKDIITYQANILSEYKTAFNHFRASGRFTPQEITYLSQVYNNLFDRSLQDLNELGMILTSGQLRMSDDERLKGIDKLYEGMRDKLSFLRKFNKQTRTLERQRDAQQRDAGAQRKLNGLQ